MGKVYVEQPSGDWPRVVKGVWKVACKFSCNEGFQIRFSIAWLPSSSTNQNMPQHNLRINESQSTYTRKYSSWQVYKICEYTEQQVPCQMLTLGRTKPAQWPQSQLRAHSRARSAAFHGLQTLIHTRPRLWLLRPQCVQYLRESLRPQSSTNRFHYKSNCQHLKRLQVHIESTRRLKIKHNNV